MKADLLALRQQHLRSRALSTAGSDFFSSDEDAEEGEQLQEISGFFRPSRHSRCGAFVCEIVHGATYETTKAVKLNLWLSSVHPLFSVSTS